MCTGWATRPLHLLSSTPPPLPESPSSTLKFSSIKKSQPMRSVQPTALHSSCFDGQEAVGHDLLHPLCGQGGRGTGRQLACDYTLQV